MCRYLCHSINREHELIVCSRSWQGSSTGFGIYMYLIPPHGREPGIWLWPRLQALLSLWICMFF